MCFENLHCPCCLAISPFYWHLSSFTAHYNTKGSNVLNIKSPSCQKLNCISYGSNVPIHFGMHVSAAALKHWSDTQHSSMAVAILYTIAFVSVLTPGALHLNSEACNLTWDSVVVSCKSELQIGSTQCMTGTSPHCCRCSYCLTTQNTSGQW